MTRLQLTAQFFLWALPRVALGLAGFYAFALALWAIAGDGA